MSGNESQQQHQLSLSPQFTQLTTKTFEQWNCAALSSKRFPVFNNLNRCLQSLTPPHSQEVCYNVKCLCQLPLSSRSESVRQCFQCADLGRSPISPLACFVPLEIPRNLIGKRHCFKNTDIGIGIHGRKKYINRLLPSFCCRSIFCVILDYIIVTQDSCVRIKAFVGLPCQFTIICS